MVSPIPKLMILASGFSAKKAFRRRPISGKRYPPANLAKFSLRSTCEAYSGVLLIVLLLLVEGAKALAVEAINVARQMAENFIFDEQWWGEVWLVV